MLKVVPDPVDANPPSAGRCWMSRPRRARQMLAAALQAEVAA